jgi:hypothetical protein
MSGFFGVISGSNCVDEVFYGTDYHSHLGTRRAGLVYYLSSKGFWRSIHNIENAYFRNKFEAELPGLESNAGIGIISDTDPQPLFSIPILVLLQSLPSAGLLIYLISKNIFLKRRIISRNILMVILIRLK